MSNGLRGYGVWLLVAIGSACSSPDALFSNGDSAGAAGLARAGSMEDPSEAGDSASGAADVGGGPAARGGSGGLPAGGDAGAFGVDAGAGAGGKAVVGGADSGGSSGTAPGSGGKGAGSGGASGNGGASGSGGASGNAGRGGASGSAGKGGSGGGSGSGGSVDEGPSCPASCDSNADCQSTAGGVTCTCRSGFVGDGKTCARPVSCNELHVAQPALPSGLYTLKPSGSTAFTSYCEMAAQEGGWTLVLNEGRDFEPSAAGVTGSCYNQSCTNLAYSTVLLVSDVMLDMRDGAIMGNNQLARVVVNGVKPTTRGKTVRTLFTTGTFYLEREDNSNLTVQLSGAKDCESALPQDMAALVCNSCPTASATCRAPVLVFGDKDSSCVTAGTNTFAIGGAESYTVPWTNCAGWPQSPALNGIPYYPENFRVWVR